jgi:hypothetical protein
MDLGTYSEKGSLVGNMLPSFCHDIKYYPGLWVACRPLLETLPQTTPDVVAKSMNLRRRPWTSGSDPLMCETLVNGDHNSIALSRVAQPCNGEVVSTPLFNLLMCFCRPSKLSGRPGRGQRSSLCPMYPYPRSTTLLHHESHPLTSSSQEPVDRGSVITDAPHAPPKLCLIKAGRWEGKVVSFCSSATLASSLARPQVPTLSMRSIILRKKNLPAIRIRRETTLSSSQSPQVHVYSIMDWSPERRHSLVELPGHVGGRLVSTSFRALKDH